MFIGLFFIIFINLIDFLFSLICHNFIDILSFYKNEELFLIDNNLTFYLVFFFKQPDRRNMI